MGRGSSHRSSRPLPAAVRQNLHTIAGVDRALSGRRSAAERAGEAVAEFFGSPPFIAAHVAAIGACVAVNVRPPVGVRPFDPFPFGLLSLVVGVEFILLTTFVLLNPKHQLRRDDALAAPAAPAQHADRAGGDQDA